MPVEAKPLFRPDVLRARMAGFVLPSFDKAKLERWAGEIASGRIDRHGEQEILPGFLQDFFVELLGYTGPAGRDRYTIGYERYVQVDGKYADAVLGDFNGRQRYLVALEGKGPRDPLDRPFAGRRMSAVDQGYRYAINLPCDWIVVTSIRETRLYHKGSNQQTYERFDTESLADSEQALRRFVFLLGAERVAPASGECHFYDLFKESEKVGRELTKEFYVNYANLRQDAFERLSRDNAACPRRDVLSATQKPLERVLFMAFCEDRGLLPPDTIRKAFEHRDPYNPRPVWENFRGLFGAIDRGNAALGIHGYNGGLFAADAVLDSFRVSDEVCAGFRELGEFDYKPPSTASGETKVIDVDILGHIFEQSISDLEKLRNELEGLAEPLGAEKHKTRRKKEGAFYTPSFITRYIVEQALGGALRDRYERLRTQHEAGAKGAAKAALANPRVYELDALTKPARAALVKFWEAWQDDLVTVRMLDPACGSGAFLIEAFDQLHATYERSNDRLAELRGHRTLFDLDKRILENNLYGVDLNDEAIEICRLSLWIKTAERGKALTSLDHPIRVGNSVVADVAVHPKALDWQAAFPEVFAQGGFDVVVGNPPYIRQEMLTAFKPHWQKRFPKVFAGTADIYAYFYALGCELLRPTGRLAFISSNGFARAGFAEQLRRFLVDEMRFEQFIDLGDTQVFTDAKDVYPAVVVLSKPAQHNCDPIGKVRTLRLRRSDDPSQINELVATSGWDVPLLQLSHEGWQFDEPAIIALRTKLQAKGKPLGEYVEGSFFVGIKTALNEAFVVDTATRAELIRGSSRCLDVLKPFVGGQELRRWYHEDSDRWVILFPNGVTASACESHDENTAWKWLVNNYPPIAAHLGRHEAQGRKRLDQGEFWWELRACDYYDAFERPKIMYPDIAKGCRFHLDPGGLYASNTTYFLPVGDWFLLGVLNSKATWFSLAGISSPFGERAGEFRYRLFSQYVGKLPIPEADEVDRAAIAQLAERCNTLAPRLHELQRHVRRRLQSSFGESANGETLGSLNQKAQAWWEVSPSQLGAALKTSFKLPGNPLLNPRIADEWEPYLAEKRGEVERLTRQLAEAEAEINDRVFRLFQLTPDEIAILQREVEH